MTLFETLRDRLHDTTTPKGHGVQVEQVNEKTTAVVQILRVRRSRRRRVLYHVTDDRGVIDITRCNADGKPLGWTRSFDDAGRAVAMVAELVRERH
jgi:hypothetical protein